MSLSSEETLRARRLHVLLEDEMGGHRIALVATDPIVKAVEKLAEASPHGHDAISVVADACALSLLTKVPVTLPPIILVVRAWYGEELPGGSSGYGASTRPHITIPVNSGHLFGVLGGLASSWKGATAGRIAKTLIEHGFASPIVVRTRSTNQSSLSSSDRPHDSLLSPLGARKRESLERRVTTISDLMRVPDPLRDRQRRLESLPRPIRIVLWLWNCRRRAHSWHAQLLFKFLSSRRATPGYRRDPKQMKSWIA